MRPFLFVAKVTTRPATGSRLLRALRATDQATPQDAGRQRGIPSCQRRLCWGNKGNVLQHSRATDDLAQLLAAVLAYLPQPWAWPGDGGEELGNHRLLQRLLSRTRQQARQAPPRPVAFQEEATSPPG